MRDCTAQKLAANNTGNSLSLAFSLLTANLTEYLPTFI